MIFWHIVLKGPEWTIQARIRIHNKPITDLIFGTFTNNKFGSNSDLFSIGLDRKICRIANNALSLRKNVDKNSDPLVISYFQGQAHHIFSLFLNLPIYKFYTQNFLCFFFHSS